MTTHNDIEQALTAALPTELRPHAAEVAVLLALAPAEVAARLAVRPVLGVALLALVGQTLDVAGSPLQVIAGSIGTLQQVTVSGGYVERIVGTAITIQLPPTPRVIDLAAAQELFDALPLTRIPDLAPLPPGSRMPFRRNPLFVGRECDLKALARALAGGSTVAIGQVAAATGLGGIGKTNLATEFVHRYGQFFAGGVCWLSFSDPAAIPAEVAASGALLLDQPDWAALKPDDQVRLVRAAWEEPIPRLLVFDNCDDTEAMRAEVLLAEWLPASGGAHVLVTSRRGTWDMSLGVTPCALGVLARAESVALLRALRGNLSERDANTIAEAVGDLPLALHLAGSFLAAYPSITPADYLHDLGTALLAHTSLEGRGSCYSPTDHERHVAQTFALSYERLDPDDSIDAAARALLACAACFAPGEPIPRDLLFGTMRAQRPGLLRWIVRTLTRHERRAADSLLGEDGLRRLLGLGLLEEMPDGALRMHRLLAAFVVGQGNDSVAQAAVKVAVLSLISQTVELNSAYYPALRPIDAHLRHLGAMILAEPGAGSVELHWRLGDYLFWINDDGLAEVYLQAGLERSRTNHNRRIEACCLLSLGDIHARRGDLPAAENAFHQALNVYHRISDRPGEANCLWSLGNFYTGLGKLPGAEIALQQALNIYRQLNDRLGEANCLLSLGDIYAHRHDLPAAEIALQQVLNIYRQLKYPRGEAIVLARQSRLRLIANDLGGAEALLTKAITGYTEIHDHYSIAESIANFGRTLQEIGRRDEARPYLARAAAQFAKIGLKERSEQYRQAAEEG